MPSPMTLEGEKNLREELAYRKGELRQETYVFLSVTILSDD